MMQLAHGAVFCSHAFTKSLTIHRKCFWAAFHGTSVNNLSFRFSNNSVQSSKPDFECFISIVNKFRNFTSIYFVHRVEWPGKENQAAQPKGYVYIIFESEKQVRELLNACTIQDGNDANSGNYYFKISSKRIKAKEVCHSFMLYSDFKYVRTLKIVNQMV